MDRCFLKIVSGGQTGVDRAALDFALDRKINCGGWCPKGRLAEDGRLDERYPLKETPSANYLERTEANVRDSEATLILTIGEPEGGTAYTVEMAIKWGRPFFIIDFTQEQPLELLKSWIIKNKIRVLNIAGPRASKQPSIYQQAYNLLSDLMALLKNVIPHMDAPLSIQ